MGVQFQYQFQMQSAPQNIRQQQPQRMAMNNNQMGGNMPFMMPSNPYMPGMANSYNGSQMQFVNSQQQIIVSVLYQRWMLLQTLISVCTSLHVRPAFMACIYLFRR